MSRDHSIIFDIASKYCISDSFVDYDGYSNSSKEFLPTVVDIMVIWVKFTYSSPFLFADSYNVNSPLPSPVWPLPISLIHGPNSPDSYAILLFTASDFTSITSHIHNWVLFFFGSISLFILELFFHWSLHTHQRCLERSNKLCAPGPSDPTETETELCLSVSCGGTGQQWTAIGAGALGAVYLGTA